MADWALMNWYLKNRGCDVWMVCRNGHLWEAELPMKYDVVSTTARGREVMRRVTSCELCRMIKLTGAAKGLRGIRSVCPDAYEIIKARRLLNGTIEHHHPEQVAAVYSEERVKEWRALLALVSLTYGACDDE